MTIKIILKPRKTDIPTSSSSSPPPTSALQLPPPPPSSPPPTLIIRKNKPETKPKVVVVVKTVLSVDQGERDIPTVNVQDDGVTLNDSDLSTILKGKKDLSKEETIEQVESQRDTLVKGRARYSEADYQYKLSIIDALLSKLKVGWIQTNVSEMQVKRATIDQIILNKKMTHNQFKGQTDLTGENDHHDPHTMVLIEGRSFFEKQRDYHPVPKELESKNPANEKNRMKGFGNKPIPTDLRRLVNFV